MFSRLSDTVLRKNEVSKSKQVKSTDPSLIKQSLQQQNNIQMSPDHQFDCKYYFVAYSFSGIPNHVKSMCPSWDEMSADVDKLPY